MQDAGLVRRSKTICETDDELDHFLPRPWTRLDPVSERTAVNELADKVLTPVLLAGVMDREDVGVIERGCELRLALEAPPIGRVGQVRGDELDRDGAIQLRVRRAVDRAHPAFAKLMIEAIWAEHCARRERAHDRKDTKIRGAPLVVADRLNRCQSVTSRFRAARQPIGRCPAEWSKRTPMREWLRTHRSA